MDVTMLLITIRHGFQYLPILIYTLVTYIRCINNYTRDIDLS